MDFQDGFEVTGGELVVAKSSIILPCGNVISASMDMTMPEVQAVTEVFNEALQHRKPPSELVAELQRRMFTLERALDRQVHPQMNRLGYFKPSDVN